MADSRQRQVENAVAGVQQRHGPQMVLRGSELAPRDRWRTVADQLRERFPKIA